MITKEKIDQFLSGGKIALAGVSRNPKKFSNMVMRDLASRGFEILPVNPHADKLEGVKCYPSIKDLPKDVNRLLIITPKESSAKIMEDVVGSFVDKVWIQQMSDSPEAIQIANDNGVDLITGKCIYMFADPVKGIHGFHRILMKLFGKLPN